MREASQMNEAKLIREIKEIVYYIRQYGIDHVEASVDDIIGSEALASDFYIQVHKGFYFAQEKALHLLRKLLTSQKQLKKDLSEARRQRDSQQIRRLMNNLKKAEYQECVVRKTMDAIVWQLFNYELSTLRRLYCGEEPIDITDSNIQSEINYINHFRQHSPTGFTLISDLTSFVQIGDIVERIPNDCTRFVELKEGAVNAKILQIMHETAQNPCPSYLITQLQNENRSFLKHFKRTVKQAVKDGNACDTINTGNGIDQASGLNIQIKERPFSIDTYSSVMHNLSIDYHKKGYATATIQNCLIIGVYEVHRFPFDAFARWANHLNIKGPYFDLRQSFYEPLARPIYLDPFTENFITSVITGDIVVRMAMDTEQWFKLLQANGCSIRVMSKKETVRIKAQSKARNTLYELEGKGVEIEKDGNTIYLGQGIFSKIFTSFFTPLDACREILATLEGSKVSTPNAVE